MFYLIVWLHLLQNKLYTIQQITACLSGSVENRTLLPTAILITSKHTASGCQVANGLYSLANSNLSQNYFCHHHHHHHQRTFVVRLLLSKIRT